MTAHPVIAAPPPTVRVTLPMKTVSEANTRDHYHAKAARVADHRGTTLLVLRGHIAAAGPGLRAPYVVTLTRIAKKDLDDDNLRGALKAVRDGVADALGIDDGSDRAVWHYAQRRGKPGDVTIVRGYGVCIEIESFKLGVWPYTCRVKGCHRAVMYDAPGGGACSLEHRT